MNRGGGCRDLQCDSNREVIEIDGLLINCILSQDLKKNRHAAGRFFFYGKTNNLFKRFKVHGSLLCLWISTYILSRVSSDVVAIQDMELSNLLQCNG
jgi:hypothetical protein